MKNNKSLTINSFEEMTDIFFKNLPERKENWGPIVFEYTIHFLHGFLFEPEYHFDKKSYDINNFTSILNNENYNFHQKSSLFKTIYYRTNIKDVFYYIDSLKKEDKETCVNFLSGSIELHLREDLLNSFSNNEELIKIFKEVLLLETKK